MMKRSHNEIVREQFGFQARPFSTAVHANDPRMLEQYLRMIDLRPGERVIDFCSGPGIVAEQMERTGRVFCLDVTHEMLLEARLRARSAHLVEAHAGSAPFAPAPGRPRAFDVAVSRLSLHHVERPEEVVREMARVVSPGGRIILNDIVTSENDQESAYTERIERLRDPSHARCLKPSELAAIPGLCGLKVTSTEPYVSTLDHDEWMNRVFPPEENRAEVRSMLEDIAGKDMGGMRVDRHGEELWISRRGLIVSCRLDS